MMKKVENSVIVQRISTTIHTGIISLLEKAKDGKIYQ